MDVDAERRAWMIFSPRNLFGRQRRCVFYLMSLLDGCSASHRKKQATTLSKSLTWWLSLTCLCICIDRFTLHSIPRSTTEVGPTIGHRRRLLFSESNAACHHMQHVRTSS